MWHLQLQLLIIPLVRNEEEEKLVHRFRPFNCLGAWGMGGGRGFPLPPMPGKGTEVVFSFTSFLPSGKAVRRCVTYRTLHDSSNPQPFPSKAPSSHGSSSFALPVFAAALLPRKASRRLYGRWRSAVLPAADWRRSKRRGRPDVRLLYQRVRRYSPVVA